MRILEEFKSAKVRRAVIIIERTDGTIHMESNCPKSDTLGLACAAVEFAKALFNQDLHFGQNAQPELTPDKEALINGTTNPKSH